jgi:multidrug efflux pump
LAVIITKNSRPGATSILAKARENPNLINLDYDYKEGKPQLKIRLDTDRAADLGVSTIAIGNTLQTMFGSREVTTYLDRGEEYDVVLQNTYAGSSDTQRFG